ncbi:hypothetical protein SAMN03159341_13629 [Paenibacillus sp. 1_12]|nr:hypothetical protein SAMN03159341_13629 [Paenibacillus sp. 1_12]
MDTLEKSVQSVGTFFVYPQRAVSFGCQGIPGLALLTDIHTSLMATQRQLLYSPYSDASLGEHLSYNLSNRLTLDISISGD